MRSNTIWVIPWERSFCSSTDKRNYLGNGAMYTECHWNYIQGQCLNWKFTGITLLFLAHIASIMPYLYSLFPPTIYYPRQRLIKYLSFQLEFNKCFPCPSHWRARKAEGSCSRMLMDTHYFFSILQRQAICTWRKMLHFQTRQATDCSFTWRR